MKQVHKLLYSIPVVNRILSNHGRYLSNLSATFISQAATALSVLILTPILVKQLGTEGFGVYGVLLNIIVFSSIFDFGLNIGLLRSLIHEKTESVWLINAMFFFFVGTFVMSIPLYYFIYQNGIVKNGHQFFNVAF
jgi:O-antigen/teichoic acid export membrane protein